LLPPFIPPCVNMEACPYGCEDPAHPGHVRLCSRNPAHRAAHLASCPQRTIQCLICKPSHSLPDSKLAAHIESLFRDPSTHAVAAAQVTALCRSAQPKSVSSHFALEPPLRLIAAASARLQTVHSCTPPAASPRVSLLLSHPRWFRITAGRCVWATSAIAWTRRNIGATRKSCTAVPSLRACRCITSIGQQRSIHLRAQ
jgi:hypothetical protein